jgi:hypothetical protein
MHADRITKMAEISNEDTVRWEGLVERLTGIADEAKNATSTALAAFLTREVAADWLIIDRSLLIATAVRDSMQRIYSNVENPHKRNLIAVALFELGDMSVVPDLVDAVENDQNIFMLAANKLTSKSVSEAAPAILKRLESSLNADEMVVATLLRALCRVSDELPEKTYDSLKETKSEQIHDALSHFRRG